MDRLREVDEELGSDGDGFKGSVWSYSGDGVRAGRVKVVRGAGSGRMAPISRTRSGQGLVCGGWGQAGPGKVCAGSGSGMWASLR